MCFWVLNKALIHGKALRILKAYLRSQYRPSTWTSIVIVLLFKMKRNEFDRTFSCKILVYFFALGIIIFTKSCVNTQSHIFVIVIIIFSSLRPYREPFSRRSLSFNFNEILCFILKISKFFSIKIYLVQQSLIHRLK